MNEAGHESIDKEVKKLFKKMHGGKAVEVKDAILIMIGFATFVIAL
nr:putative holin-like toxin [Cohnella panacarvi]